MQAARCPAGAQSRPSAARIDRIASGRLSASIRNSSNSRRRVAAPAAASSPTAPAAAAPPPETEPAARAKFEASGPATQDRCLSVLREAARTRSTPPEQVEGALSLLETISSSSSSSSASPPPAADRVLGSCWWLLFSTATPLRAFQYIPVRELFRVGPDRVALDSRVGPVRFIISGPTTNTTATGPAAAGPAYDASTGALSFTFTRVAAYWSPFSGDAELPAALEPFWSTQVKAPKAKSYTFYYAEDGPGGVAAARSSGGGLALLTRV